MDHPKSVPWVVNLEKFYCILLYVLAIPKVKSGLVPTCDSARWWRLYIIVLPHWEIRPLTPWPDIPQSHYSDTVPTNPCPFLLMQSARLGSEYKFDKFYKSFFFVLLGWDSKSQPSSTQDVCALSTWLTRPVHCMLSAVSLSMKGSC